MWSLLPVCIFSLIMAFFSGRNSTFELDKYGERKYVHKEKLFYILMAVGMAVFVGLRTRGNDTFTYRQMYEGIAADHLTFSDIDWLNFSAAPGFKFVSIFLNNIGATTQDYFMVFALFTVCIYLWFIRKYTNNILFSVYFFITMGVYTFTMAAIKQTTAVAFLLIATDRAISKKNVRFLFWVLIAELFHPYAFVFLIIPFLFFNPWSSRTWWLLGGTIVIALSLSYLMGGILSMTDMLGASYGENEFSGEGVNIFRVLVVWIPVVISFFGKEKLRSNNDRISNLCINASMINAVIMFIGLFGTANYFARLANYFLIFQTISLPWLFRFFDNSNRKIFEMISIMCFFLYFYYDTVIAQGAFDNTYSFISVFDFIKQLY